MPGVDGYQATRLIREAEKAKKSTKPVAIFGITAGGMEGVQEKCFSCGMDGYLNKPLRMDDLQEYVGKMLFARDDTVIPPAPFFKMVMIKDQLLFLSCRRKSCMWTRSSSTNSFGCLEPRPKWTQW